MLFERKHLLAASQMEARRREEVIGVLDNGAELADNTELGDGAQRAGVGAAQAAVRAVGGWVSHGGHW